MRIGGFREGRSTHPTCAVTTHEKARRGFPAGRNFGVSISLVDGFGGQVKKFVQPVGIKKNAVMGELNSAIAAARQGSIRLPTLVKLVNNNKKNK